MSGRTSWYYRPTNSPRYPGVGPRDAFMTEQMWGRPGLNSLPASARSSARSSVMGTRLLGVRAANQKSPEEQKVWLENVGRPTMASMQKFDHPKQGWHAANRYMTVDGTSYLWHRMDYMKDTYKLLYSPHGTVKTSFTK